MVDLVVSLTPDESLSEMTTALRGPTLNCWGPLGLPGALRLPGAPQIAEGPSDCWGPHIAGPLRLLEASQVDRVLRLSGAIQIAESPSDCWRPLRIAEAPQFAGDPSDWCSLSQIVMGPSDCWGPLILLGAPSDCWELLRLMGPLRLSVTLQIPEGPSDCWGPSDGWGPLYIAQPAQPMATPLASSRQRLQSLLTNWMDLVFFPLISQNILSSVSQCAETYSGKNVVRNRFHVLHQLLPTEKGPVRVAPESPLQDHSLCWQ